VNEGFARLGWDAVAERMAELDRQIQYQHDANMALEHANRKLHEGYLELKAEIRELKSENRSLVQRYVRATGAVPL
jgi:cell division protein FtsB